MTTTTHRIARGLALASLLIASTQALAQRAGQAGARTQGASRPAGANTQRGTQAKQGANRNTNAATNANRNVNKNANVNRNVNNNVNVNRNVNVNNNVNVNRSWNRAPVRAGAYAWPRGYSYVRRPIGYVMPRAFLTATYFYAGYAALGLAGPPPGQQWIRYGNDLLLVDIASGQTIDVRYGVFE
jgi:Ni/Co efflux regulator RcnB